MRLFVSYAHTNRDRVVRLVQGLTRVSHEIWYDEELYGGQDWWEIILDQIAACQVFLLMVSEDSLDSVYCQTEYRYAQSLGKPILPILLYRHTIPESLRKIQFTDVSMKNDDSALMAIIGDLNQLQNELAMGRFRTTTRLIPRPPVPKGPLHELTQQVQVISRESVSQNYQDRVISRLGRYVTRDQNPKIRKEAFDLLQALLQSPYITDFARHDIRQILNPSLANTYPTNVKAIVYALLQKVKSQDAEEAERARHDLHAMLTGNVNLTMRFQTEIYAVLVYELTQIVRHGDPKAAARARGEMLGMLGNSRIGVDLEVEIYEVLVNEPLREALNGNTARSAEAREWLQHVITSPHFMDDTRAEIQKALGSKPRRVSPRFLGITLATGAAIFVLLTVGFIVLMSNDSNTSRPKGVQEPAPVNQQACTDGCDTDADTNTAINTNAETVIRSTVSVTPRPTHTQTTLTNTGNTISLIPSPTLTSSPIFMDWNHPEFLVLYFEEGEKPTLNLYDLQFVVQIGAARRVYQLNQFRELNRLPDFDIRRIPSDACIVLAANDGIEQPTLEGCQHIFFDNRGMASVATQPFWVAPATEFQVRLTNTEPTTTRDILLRVCLVVSKQCSVQVEGA